MSKETKSGKVRCGGCNGTGDCKRCGGSGKEPATKADADCIRCGGTGNCTGCGGSGWV